MTTHPIHVLLLEDNPADARLLREELLTRREQPFTLTHVVRLSEALQKLAHTSFDVILADLSLPDSQGLETLTRLSVSASGIPIVALTGLDDESLAVQAVRSGAQDYLVKGKTDGQLLTRAIRYAIERAQNRRELRRAYDELEERVQARTAQLAQLNQALQQEVAERKQAESALRESQQRLTMHVQQTPLAVIEWNLDFAVTDWNRAAEAIFGFSRQDVLGWRVVDCLVPEHERAQVMDVWRDLIAQKGGTRSTHRNLTKDGRLITCEWYNTPLVDEQGCVVGAASLAQDITARHQAEAAVRQQNAYLSALNETAVGMFSRLEVHNILEAITTRACALMNTPHGYIYLLDPHNLTMSLKIGIGAHSGNIDHTVEKGEGIAGQVWQTAQALAVEDYRSWAGRLRRFDPSIFHASVGVPLISNGQLRGVLGLAYTEPERGISKAELDFLQQFAQLAAIALDNSSLYAAAQQELVERKRAEAQTQLQLQRLSALRDIEIALTSSLDLRVTLNVFLDHLTEQLKVGAAAILRLDAVAQNFSVIASRGLRQPQLNRSLIGLGEGLAGRAASSRRLVYTADVRTVGEASPRVGWLLAEGLTAYHGVPLITKGQLKGVLELYHPASFKPEPDWLEFLEALAAQAAIAMDNTSLFEDLQRSNIELMLAYDSTIEGWSRALDLRDKETEGHTQRVTELTMQLAQRLGLNGNDLVYVRRGALLHDIGKMGIPDAILLKPGPLTPEEWDIMRKHPAYAYELLSPIQYLTPSLHIPYCHHEKWDGSGYPHHLQAEQIPLPARIFSVIDVWDALTSDRPYRKGWDVEKTIAYIREQNGKHFDPQIVEAFFAMQLGEGLSN